MSIFDISLELNKKFIEEVDSEKLEELMSSFDDMKDTKSYIREQIEQGFILEDGFPVKCKCGCNDFKQVNQYYGEGWIEEYSLECTNQDCLKIVGTWAYGNWQV